jgi:hypothetical protein
MEGFRAAFRWPSLTFGEITWRWSVGATATALFFFGLFEYLNTLPVTRGEMLLLRTRQPFLVGQAMAHILRGSLARGVMSMMVAALLLAVLWIVAASVGRIATVRFLLAYFRGDVGGYVLAHSISNGGERGVASNVSTNAWGALLRINFLRVSVVLASVVGFAGAAIVASFASPKANPQPGVAFVLFLPLAALIGFVCWALNWMLSLAGMFAVRDGGNAVDAISAAVGLCRERTGAVFAVSTWTGLAHLVVFSGATTVAAMPLGTVGVLPGRVIVLGVILVTLAYFAVADWLYMARLGGYVCIAETPEALLAPQLPMPPAGVPLLAAPLQTTIDRDEPILSDVPNLAVET